MVDAHITKDGADDLITRAVALRLAMQLSACWVEWQGAAAFNYLANLMKLRPYLAARRPEVAASISQLGREAARTQQLVQHAAAWEAGVLEQKTDEGLAVAALLLAQLDELAVRAPAEMARLVRQAATHGYPTRLDGADGQLVEELLILAHQLICTIQSTNPRLWHELTHTDNRRLPDLYWLATCASELPLARVVRDVRSQVKSAGFGFWYQPMLVAASVPAWPRSTWLLMGLGGGNRLAKVWGGDALPSNDAQMIVLGAMESWAAAWGAGYRIVDCRIYAARLGLWIGRDANEQEVSAW